MKGILIIIVVFLSFFSFSQEIPKAVYEISLISRPQKLILNEYEYEKFEGLIITEITKGTGNPNFLQRFWKKIWKIDNEELVLHSKINNNTTKELILKLREEGIETLEDCLNDEECSKIGFLDGGTVTFKVKIDEIDRLVGFEEIYPLTENNKEKNQLRFKAQKLLTILYNDIDLNKEFLNLFKELPKRKYHWYQASGSNIVTITNRNIK
ncbi:hypothetical protein [Flavobacterium okayamense]|uniref:GLPGLI family protein n=1 Tax=Flavobacterium okayamense TaxID=2830782 RepID=A0ABM7S610_9FLAO|nr:hypothetical protein [Flavobacterium okayamense]BCY28918.1 hypothetical protein KK2020170_17860 [Flavobacterium okayamense]